MTLHLRLQVKNKVLWMESFLSSRLPWCDGDDDNDDNNDNRKLSEHDNNDSIKGQEYWDEIIWKTLDRSPEVTFQANKLFVLVIVIIVICSSINLKCNYVKFFLNSSILKQKSLIVN